MMPDAYYKNIYEIDYNNLKSKGYKYIFLDIDNTLISYKENTSSEELKKLINNLKKDFDIFLFSNGMSNRVLKLQKELDIGAYYNSMKPLKKNYKKVLKKYDKNKCIFIGDQFMTDIWGAKRNGLKVILVDIIDSTYEPFTTHIWRFFERIHLNKLKKKGLFTKSNYYDKL